VPPAESTWAFMAFMWSWTPCVTSCPFQSTGTVTGVVVGEHAVPVGVVSSREVEVTHASKVGCYPLV
jgi:hypothetical protein